MTITQRLDATNDGMAVGTTGIAAMPRPRYATGQSGSPERVLVFGDDMRIFLAVVRSLGRAGKEVHAAPFNWHSPALKSKYITKVHFLPRYSDGTEAWLAAVQAVLHKNAFQLIVPCCDRVILPLHLHREELVPQRIAIPNPEAMDWLFDKESTRSLCGELAIPVVAGARLNANDQAAELVRGLGLPLVIKSRRSYWPDRLDAVGKVWIVDTETELEDLLPTLREPSRFLAEAFFRGDGVGLSVLAENGKILQAFQHRRLREGRGGSSSYRISEPVNSELYDACKKICERTCLNGVCMCEFRHNPTNGKWVLLETNARFWGSSPLPLSLGVDFPRFLYDLLVHRRRHAPAGYEVGIRARNFVLDSFNLFSDLRRSSKAELGMWLGDFGDFLTQPLRWISGGERSDSFVADDLRPAFSECLLLVKTLTQKWIRSKEPNPKRRRSDGIMYADRTFL